jgi:riboflavin kinase/FMN adenylyltransferase
VIDDRRIDGVTSIGHTPTFAGTESVVETHLFTEPEDFYGRTIALEFLERLRDQQKFPDVQALGRQIARDIERAKEILGRS